MERSFAAEVAKLRLGAGETFEGEGILAITKALLQAGVSYVGGYQGAPVSHLMDVLSDAKPLLDEMGIHFELSSNEAAAAALLAASIHYPMRGAVVWKSTAGTNVAADALGAVASAGVKGGALVIVGEDYGDGSSVVQERTYAYALKSSIWLLDPKPDQQRVTDLIEDAFALSEASASVVMMQFRIRACHLEGRFTARDNISPAISAHRPLERPVFDITRLNMPPVTFLQEREKVEERLPRALDFIRVHRLNDLHEGTRDGIGILVQGGLYNSLMRALAQLGLADVYGMTEIPILALNVTYPLLSDEIADFCAGKRNVMVVEEGSPAYIEEAVEAILRRAGLQTRVSGKDVLPRVGEYTTERLNKGLALFLDQAGQIGSDLPAFRTLADARETARTTARELIGATVPKRPPGFCTGCPERPVFSAIKLVEREIGPIHTAGDVGCHTFAALPPFNVGNTVVAYGLGLSSLAAVSPGHDAPSGRCAPRRNRALALQAPREGIIAQRVPNALAPGEASPPTAVEPSLSRRGHPHRTVAQLAFRRRFVAGISVGGSRASALAQRLRGHKHPRTQKLPGDRGGCRRAGVAGRRCRSRKTARRPRCGARRPDGKCAFDRAEQTDSACCLTTTTEGNMTRHPKSRRAWLATSAALALSLNGAARAQDAPAAASGTSGAQTTATASQPKTPEPSNGAPAANAPITAQSQSGIQDIVVTARRRSESLQNVPIAVTAFSGQQLAAQGVQNITEIAQLTPGLQFGAGSQARSQVFIRGIGTNRFDAFGEPSSATFVDEVYQPRFADQYFDLLNIDRIEVLKGPQGTLFGRNTIGGAISVYTPNPSQDLEASGRLEGGSQSEFLGSAYVSGGLANGIAASLAAGYHRADGFMKDTVSGKDDGYKNFAARAKLLVQPTSDIKLILTGTIIRNRQDAVLFDPGANQPILLESPILPTPPYSGNRYDHAYNNPGFLHHDAEDVSARLDWTLDFATLTSISAYQHSRNQVYQDLDASPVDAFNYGGLDHTKLFTQELRLTSRDNGPASLGGRLQWVVGLYYLHERVDETINIDFGPQSVLALITGGDAVENAVAKASTNQSYAAFGQATYKLTDKLNLTFGARYTRDTKDFIYNGTTDHPGFPEIFADYSLGGSPSWNSFTPKATIDYHVNPNVLVYATYAKGFKSGTLQSDPFDPQTAGLTVKPEKVNAYEIGLKSEFLNHTLRANLAGFYDDYTDQQVQRIVVLPSGLVTNAISNAASSTIKGVEAELTIAPSRAFQLNIDYAYLDARFDDFVTDPINNVNLKGNQMPRAPKNTVTIDGVYNYFLPNDAKLFFGGKLFWTDDYYFTAENDAPDRQPSYSVLDLRTGWASASGKFEVTGWIKNLTGTEYRLYADSVPPRFVWSPTRTGGVTVSVKY